MCEVGEVCEVREVRTSKPPDLTLPPSLRSHKSAIPSPFREWKSTILDPFYWFHRRTHFVPGSPRSVGAQRICRRSWDARVSSLLPQGSMNDDGTFGTGATRYEVGDRVSLAGDPTPHNWKVVRAYRLKNEGTVYDLQLGEVTRIAVPEERLVLDEGGARIF